MQLCEFERQFVDLFVGFSTGIAVVQQVVDQLNQAPAFFDLFHHPPTFAASRARLAFRRARRASAA
jgi:hypothetical protein